jgi:hypothetical protein
MIIGDPFKFAILAERIPAWNIVGDTSFVEGVLFMSIDGTLYPNEMTSVTLNSDLGHVFWFPNHALLTLPENGRMFELEKRSAFTELFKCACPCILEGDDREDVDNDYTYMVATTSIRDQGGEIYLVRCGDMVRVLAGTVSLVSRGNEKIYEISEKISECFISVDEMKKIVEELKNFFRTKILKYLPQNKNF